jgi:hypothetical protein
VYCVGTGTLLISVPLSPGQRPARGGRHLPSRRHLPLTAAARAHHQLQPRCGPWAELRPRPEAQGAGLALGLMGGVSL